MSKFEPLVTWRKKSLPRGLTPWQLADQLSVENVEKAGVKVPDRLYKDLVAFRHLRQDARVAAIRSMVNGHKKAPVVKEKPQKVSTIIAVYGYVSQRFDSAKDAEEWVRDKLKRGLVPRAFIVEGKVKTVEKIFKK
jgi:hypothetical protein